MSTDILIQLPNLSYIFTPPSNISYLTI
jgi:hypothetical protein